LDKVTKGLRPSPALMLLYNNVAELRQIRGTKAIVRGLLVAAAKHLNVEVADFLPQGVAVKTQQSRCADLISAGRGQGRREQWVFDLTQNAVIEACGRQAIFEPRKISREVAFDRTA